MKFGVIATNLTEGSEALCKSNGKPIAFDFAYEAVRFARELNEKISQPRIRYEPQLLPAPAPDAGQEG